MDNQITDELTEQLRAADPRDGWRAEVAAICQRELVDLADDVKDRVVRPLLRELNSDLAATYSHQVFKDARFWIGRFESLLRERAERFRSGEV